MNFDWNIFGQALLAPSHTYLYGLWLTCVMSVLAMLLGTAIGLALALMRASRIGILRYITRLYVWIVRGTPLLVQIVFLYTALAAADVFHFQDIDLGLFVVPGNVQAAIIALAMHEAAYMAEIIRAGLASVDIGQYEAARSLGMPPALLMRRIVLPQAFRMIIPPLGNEFNIMLKNTTLVSVIGVPELLLATQMVTSTNFRVFELYLTVALYFLSLTTLWGFFQQWLECRFGQPQVAASSTNRLLGGRVLNLIKGRR